MRIPGGRCFAPSAAETRIGSGIIEYRWTPTDDGKYAVVEFVARDRKALAPILADARTLKAFEKGKAKKGRHREGAEDLPQGLLPGRGERSREASILLIALTLVPVCFGALGTPIVTNNLTAPADWKLLVCEWLDDGNRGLD